MSAKSKPFKKSEEMPIEKEYRNFFQENKAPINENQSLEQPSPYPIIQSFTTYGAYEEPI